MNSVPVPVVLSAQMPVVPPKPGRALRRKSDVGAVPFRQVAPMIPVTLTVYRKFRWPPMPPNGVEL